MAQAVRFAHSGPAKVSHLTKCYGERSLIPNRVVMACVALIGLMAICNLIYSLWLRHVIDSVAAWFNVGAACDVNNIKACESDFIYYAAVQSYSYIIFMLMACGVFGHIITKMLLRTRGGKSGLVITGGLVLSVIMLPFIVAGLVSALSGVMHFILLYLIFLSALF
jgi:hypothetical protein